MKKFFLTMAAMAAVMQALACTSIIVAKGASTDGSVMCTYNCDSFGAFHPLYHFKAGRHAKGEMRKVYDRDMRTYWGEIPEAEETYNVIGNINQWQVSISETTFGGREQCVDSTGILDYGSLMDIALQRSKTAREAIKVMTTLVDTYGYNSEGESFTVCDPNEAWILEMLGCGRGSKKTVWAAVRIPDNAISAHANKSRIEKIDMKDKRNWMYSKNVISFARKMGWYSGKDADFSFCDAYCPASFDNTRYCEARVWAFFNKYASGMERYLPYASGTDLKAERMPLWIVPNRKLSVADVEAVLRDHYDGTPLDMNRDLGEGIYETPYRPTPLSFKYQGKEYFNERPISTQQTAFSWITQSRSFLPDEVGGVIWFANDDGNMAAYTPVYCCNTDVPECFKEKNGVSAVNFSIDNAYWVCNWVANMVYPRYSMLFPELKAVRDSLESGFFAAQPVVEKQALEAGSPAQAVELLTRYSRDQGAHMLQAWRDLAFKLIVKYNDGIVREEHGGHYEMNESGFRPKFTRPGYPEAVKKELVEATGDRYLVPAKP